MLQKQHTCAVLAHPLHFDTAVCCNDTLICAVRSVLISIFASKSYLHINVLNAAWLYVVNCTLMRCIVQTAQLALI